MCIRDSDEAVDVAAGLAVGAEQPEAVGQVVVAGPFQQVRACWPIHRLPLKRGSTVPVSYTHLDVYKRQV